MKLFNILMRIRFYVITMFLVLGSYIWSTVTGYKVIGDDNETKDQMVGRSNRFYHK